MKTGVADRLRKRFFARSSQADAEAAEERPALEPEVINEIAAEFTTEELQEFLEGDRQPVSVDPKFKEDLREQLWGLIEARRNGEEGGSGG